MENKKNMLIIDDSDSTQQMLAEAFSPEFNIYTAYNGQEGYDRAVKYGDILDIILLDIYMPVMNGFETLKLVKENPAASSIPVIVISAYDEQNEARVLAMGAVDMISKPYNKTILCRRVENTINMHEQEKRLLENAVLEERLNRRTVIENMFQNIDCGIMTYRVVDGVFRVIFANDIICDSIGISKGKLTELDNNGILHFIHPEDCRKVFTVARDAHEAKNNYTVDFRAINGSGEVIWMKSIAKITMISDDTVNYIVTLIDVTEDVTLHNENLYHMEHDELTGIYNAITFYSVTEKMITEKNETRFSIICFNIEKFKVINEVFGSEQADKLLKVFATLLNDYSSLHGTCGRLQADRFAICMPTNIFRDEAVNRMIINRFNSAIDGFTINVDMGVYEITDVTVPVIQMCDRASIALQTVKGNFEKNIAYYDDKMRKMLINEQNILNSMRFALETDQFTVYYQPIYNISEDSLSYAEALVRWNDPKNGLIFPSIFIPIFEKNGFISKVDYYVWESVCRFLRDRIEHNRRVVPISVNISRRSLYDERLCEKIVALTGKYNIPHDLLKLEITETAYNDNPVQLLATINKLCDNGFHILMDDFGSGYSSLNALKFIPVHTLKIDMKFMEGFEKNAKAGNIVTSVVRMAKWLNLGVIAEGVETDIQVNFLRSIGCSLIQGYVFSRPVPRQDFEDIIDSTKSLHIVQPQKMDMKDIDEIISGNSTVTRVFNNIFSGIGFYEFVDDRLEIIRVNDGYYEILGYTPESIIEEAKDVIRYVHPDDTELLLEVCRNAVNTGCTCMTTFRRYTRNGKKLLFLHAIINYVSGTEDAPIICIFFNDITEETENKRSLQLHNNYLNSLYSSLPCGILQYRFTELGCEMINANEECCKILGYKDNEELKSNFIENLNRPDNIDSCDTMLAANKRVLDGETEESCEVCLFTPNGTAIWLHFDIKKIRWVNNELIMQSIIRDITSIKVTQKQLNSIVDRIPGGICSFTISDNVNIKYASDGFYAISGFSKEEFDSRFLDDITRIIYPQDIARFVDVTYRHEGKNNVINVSFRIKTKAGGIKWIRINAVQYDVVDGEYLYSAMITEESEEALTYKSLLDAAPTGIYVSDIKDYSLLYTNSTLRRMRRLDEQNIANKKCYEVISGRSTPCPHCTMSDMTYDDFVTREHISEMDGKRYILKGRLVEWNGIPACIEYLTDDTERINSRNTLQSIMNNTPVGIFTLKYHKADNLFEPILFSNGLSCIVDYSRIEFFKMFSNGSLYEHIHPDDHSVLEQTKARITSGESDELITITVRMLTHDGTRYVYLRLNIAVIIQDICTYNVYAGILNVSAEYEMYDKLKICDSIQQVADKYAFIHYWEYDLAANTIGNNNLSPDALAFAAGVSTDGSCFPDGFLICENDITKYRELIQQARNGINGACRLFVALPDSDLPQLYTINCTVVTDIRKKPVKAVFTAENTEQLTAIRKHIELVANYIDINIWEYSIKDKMLFHSIKTDIYNSGGICDFNVPEAYVENSCIHSDDANAMLDLYKRISGGEKEARANLRWRQSDGSYDLVEVIYTAVFDSSGVPVRAIGTGRVLEKNVRSVTLEK